MKRTKPALLLFFIGLIILALSDNDAPLFSTHGKHGPSVQDAIGLLLILAAYALLVWSTWTHRRRIMRHFGAGSLLTGTALFCTGLALTIASVVQDAGLWWVPGIVMMIFVQAVVFYIALK